MSLRIHASLQPLQQNGNYKYHLLVTYQAPHFAQTPCSCTSQDTPSKDCLVLQVIGITYLLTNLLAYFITNLLTLTYLLTY
jgi:hypothetical protein